VIDWLFEGRLSVYIALAGLAVFLLFLWQRRRKRGYLIGVAVSVALIGLYALLDVTIESDREQILRKVNEMAAAFNAGNLDAAFVHISDHFRSPRGQSKQALREMAQHYRDQQIVERIIVWDIVCLESPSRMNGTTRVFFSVKAIGFREFLADCDAIFDFDGQHGWRMRAVRLFKPQTNEEWPTQF
jgi:hypothetical protein